MGIFKKKLDYEYDGLNWRFDLQDNKYYMYSRDNKERITNKDLNFRSRRFLKKKNKMTEAQLLEARDIAEAVEKIKKEGLARKALIDRRKEAGMDLRYGSFEMEEKEYKLSKEVRDYLEDLAAEEKNTEYVLGIHRIGPDDAHLENIFREGIIVQGHATGAARGTPSLGDTVGYYPENKTIIKEVGLAYAYKASKGSIVVKIPKEDIIANNIYITDEDGKNMYLNPKYIVGYFPVEEDRTVSQMVTGDTLEAYRQQRKKEAEAYISMGDKKVEYPPQEK